MLSKAVSNCVQLLSCDSSFSLLAEEGLRRDWTISPLADTQLCKYIFLKKFKKEEEKYRQTSIYIMHTGPHGTQCTFKNK